VAYHHIQRKISTRELRAGEPVSDVAISKELGISRTPAREAIRQLVSEGLLESVPGRGVVVITLDRNDIRELFEMREALEGLAAALAAQGPEKYDKAKIYMQQAIQRAMPEPVLARLLRSWYSGGQREYEQVATEDFRRCGKRTFLAALKELAHVDVRARLGEVAAPMLVACGSRDRANLGPSREIAAAVPAISTSCRMPSATSRVASERRIIARPARACSRHPARS